MAGFGGCQRDTQIAFAPRRDLFECRLYQKASEACSRHYSRLRRRQSPLMDATALSTLPRYLVLSPSRSSQASDAGGSSKERQPQKSRLPARPPPRLWIALNRGFHAQEHRLSQYPTHHIIPFYIMIHIYRCFLSYNKAFRSSREAAQDPSDQALWEQYRRACLQTVSRQLRR